MSTPDLSYLLDHTSHVLRTRVAAALAEIGLTARMHCVLAHALPEERTQIQLAEMGDMDKTTMVVTVDALERAGLAQRRPSRTDRRARIIAVTEEGARPPGHAGAEPEAGTPGPPIVPGPRHALPPAGARLRRDVFPAMLLAGGFGLVLPALSALGMSAARAEDAGLASGLFNTTQQLGMAFGVAVLSTLAAARTADRVALGDDRATALTSGFHAAFALGAGLVLVAAGLAYALLRPRTTKRADAPALVGRLSRGRAPDG